MAFSAPDEFPPEFESLIRSAFGPAAEEILAALRAADFDPRILLQGIGAADDPAAQALIASGLHRALAQGSPGEVVNWDLAHDVARQAAQAGGDPMPGASAQYQVAEALRVGDLWLDQATAFGPSAGAGEALSSAQWVEITWDAWQHMVTPVAVSVADALTAAISRRDHSLEGEPSGDMADGLANMMRSMGGAVFAMQIGQAIGTLARETIGLTDIGLPLTDPHRVALAPAAIGRFTAGLGTPHVEVRLFLAVREAASARLFTHVPWLGPHLMGSVEAYARGIRIDVERIETALASLDRTDPDSMRQALAGGLFDLERTDTQKAALERLETTLALVEGWVDDVAAHAVGTRLPGAAGLAEMIQRRRATGGPAQRTFATLVGLDLRPRRAREAASLWRAVADADGIVKRDALWSHPDLLPDAEELGRPEQFVQSRAERAAADADVDAAIAELLGDDS
jgi:putative hydrolase